MQHYDIMHPVQYTYDVVRRVICDLGYARELTIEATRPPLIVTP